MAGARFAQAVTFVYTDDLDASASFYGDILGLELVLDQGACRIFRIAPEAYLGVCRRGRRAPQPDGVIVTLVTDDVDGWHDRLTTRGVVFEGPPRDNDDFRIRHCFLRDPAGYLLEIQRFDDPAWPRPARAP